MSAAAWLAALAVGAAFGYGARRGAFCMSSGFRGAVEGDWTKVKALGLAVAVQLVVLPVIFAAGLSRPAVPGLQPMAAIAGGVLFGLSMPWAGGCAAGVWYKLGAGDLGALLAVLGVALGATAAETGPLVGVRSALQRAGGVPAAWTPAPWVPVAAGVALALALSRTRDGRAGAWTWRRTGGWIGAAAILAWPASALAHRDFGLAVVPGSTGILSGIAGQGWPVWDVCLVLGVAAGGWLAARREGPVALRSPAAPVLGKRFAGGLGLGLGASVAAGCTVGHGLTGLALLAPGSLLATLAIFGGTALGVAFAGRRHPGARGSSLPAVAGEEGGR